MQIIYKRLVLFPLCLVMANGTLTAQLEDTNSSNHPALLPSQQPLQVPTGQGKKAAPQAKEEPLPELQEESLMPSEPNQSEQIKAIILEQLDAIHSQDLSKAYYAYTGLDFQRTVPLEAFKIFIKQNPAFFRSRAFEVQSMTFTGILVTVKGVLEDSNHRQTLVQYDFLQENGIWKIRKLVLFSPAANSK